MKANDTVGVAIETFPTPIAAPVLACVNAVTARELAQALRFLQVCIYGFLHAVALARLRHVRPITSDHQPAFTRAWQWGDPETVIRLHACLRRLDAGKTGVWAASCPWLEGLTSLTDDVTQAGEESPGLPIIPRTLRALESGLRELLSTRLAFTCGWTLFYNAPAEPGEPALVYQGPVPLRRPLSFRSPTHFSSGLHLHAGDDVFPVEPFCRREQPVVAPGAKGATAVELGRPSLHVTIALDRDSASMALPECGSIQQRNDFAQSLWSGSQRNSHLGIRENGAWGVMLLRVCKMRELNERFGYVAGDRILAAVDACASRFASGPGSLPGALTAFPFWRRGGELLIPFRMANDLGGIAAASGVLDLAAEIVAATHRAGREGGMVLSLQVGIRLDAGISRHDILAASEAIRDELSDIGVAEEGTLWRLELGDDSPIAIRRDGIFTRVSRAAFGLIHRHAGSAREYLLRFNGRHGRYNFVGGHIEPEDGDSPMQTLAREFQEELALFPGSYSAAPILPGPLHHIAFSSAHRAHTLYVHHFFAIAGLAEGPIAALPQPDCRWFSVEQLGKPLPEISSVPLNALGACFDLRSAHPPDPGTLAEAVRALFGLGG